MGNGIHAVAGFEWRAERGQAEGKGEPDWKTRLAQQNEAKLKLIAKLKKQVRQV